MKHIKYVITSLVVYTTLLLFTTSLDAQIFEAKYNKSDKAVENDNNEVNFGSRPPIDLKNVSKDAYHEGKIRIQFEPHMEKSLEDIVLKAKDNEYVKTNISALDELNKAHKVYEYKPMLNNLYNVSPVSEKYHERHKEWGFHLWYELSIDNKSDIIGAIRDFKKINEVEIAEPVYKIRLIEPVESNPMKENSTGSKWTPNDPYYEDSQWHFNNTGQDIGQAGTPGWDINVEDAWEIEKGNTEVVVAILDSGIEFEHEDLSGNMWDDIGPEETETSPGSHGTHVAGTVSAVTNNEIGVAGIAGGSGENDGARLMSINIFSGGLNDFESFVYAADNGAAISQNSWGYEDPDVYNQSALDGIDYFNTNGGGNALLNGGITIFAAGNDDDDGKWYPAYYGYDDPETLGAMAVASHDNRGEKSGFSNYGDWVDITAPGTNIASTELSSEDPPYSYKSGTSMSCPHVSGVAALAISNNIGVLNNEMLWNAIVNSAREDLYEENPDYEGLLGSGALDAHAAILLAQDYAGVPIPASFNATAKDTSSIEIKWEKNEENHDVMLAWNYYGEVIGQPEDGEIYEVGDTIPGGGTVIYTNNANNTYIHDELEPGEGHAYKIWSIADEDTEDYDAVDYSVGIESHAFTDCVPITELPFHENFDDEHSYIQHSWSFTDHIGNNQVWQLGTIQDGLKIDNGLYAYINSNHYEPDDTQNAGLITPVFDLTEYQKVTLEFEHYFRQWEDVSVATLLYSIDNGENWQEIKTWESSTTNPSIFRKVIDEVGGESQVQFKWSYVGNWGFYWCVDDVKLMETEDWHYADFTSSHKIIPVGEQVTFEDATSTEDFIEWEWDFGDGAEPATASDKGPHSVIYNTTGLKSPSMTIDDNESSYTITKPNLIDVFEITDKLHWDDGVNENAIGLGSQNTWQVAARFKTSDLKFYDDYIIEGINVYINHLPDSAKLKIWEKDEEDNFNEVVSQPFEPEEEEWNNISLNFSHRINSDKELWLGVEYKDPGEGVFIAGIDVYTNHDRKGNLLRLDIDDANAWIPASLYGLDGDWNLQAKIIYGENEKIVNFGIDSGEGTLTAEAGGIEITSGDLVLEGADVTFTATPDMGYYLENWKNNDIIVEDHTDETFIVENIQEDIKVTVDFECICHQVVFNVIDNNGLLTAEVNDTEISSGDEVLEGKDVLFTATPDDEYRLKEWTVNDEILDDYDDLIYEFKGIDDNVKVEVKFEEAVTVDDLFINNISIFPNPAQNKFTVESEEKIKTIKLFDISGQVIKDISVDALSIDVNVANMDTGIYFVEIHTSNSILTQSIQVIK